MYVNNIDTISITFVVKRRRIICIMVERFRNK